MKRFIAMAARLYPRAWRERYGEEFDALLEEAPADFRQLTNVAQGAIAMQIANRTAYVKAVGAMALVGAVLALAASYRQPARYVSEATLRLRAVPHAGPPVDKQLVSRELQDRILEMKYQLIGRDSLLQVLHDPKLQLFATDREVWPLEDIAQQMQGRHDLEVRPVRTERNGSTVVSLSFTYSDPERAQAAALEFSKRLVEQNLVDDRQRAYAWESTWTQPVPFRTQLDLVQPASLPTSLSEPRRSLFLSYGAAAGLILGLLAVGFWRYPRRSLWLIAGGLLGSALAAALSTHVPEWYTAKTVMIMAPAFDPAHLSVYAPNIPFSTWVKQLKPKFLHVPHPQVDFPTVPASAIEIRRGDQPFNFEMLASAREPETARKLAQYFMDWMLRQAVAEWRPLPGEILPYGPYGMLETFEMPAAGELSTHNRLWVTLSGSLLGLLAGAVFGRRLNRPRPLLRQAATVALTLIMLAACGRDARKQYLQSGDDHFRHGSYQEAAAQYEKARDLLPRDGLTHYKLAITYKEMKPVKIVSVLKEYRRAIELLKGDPSHRDEYQRSLVGLTEIMLMFGPTTEQFMKEVVDSCAALFELDPNSFDGFRFEGDLAYKRSSRAGLTPQERADQLAMAVEEYRKADNIQPGNIGVSLQMGTVLAREKQYGEAEKYYRIAIDQAKVTKKSGFYYSYSGLFRFYLAEGKSAAADKLLDEATLVDPRNVSEWNQLRDHR